MPRVAIFGQKNLRWSIISCSWARRRAFTICWIKCLDKPFSSISKAESESVILSRIYQAMRRSLVYSRQLRRCLAANLRLRIEYGMAATTTTIVTSGETVKVAINTEIRLMTDVAMLIRFRETLLISSPKSSTRSKRSANSLLSRLVSGIWMYLAAIFSLT